MCVLFLRRTKGLHLGNMPVALQWKHSYGIWVLFSTLKVFTSALIITNISLTILLIKSKQGTSKKDIKSGSAVGQKAYLVIIPPLSDHTSHPTGKVSMYIYIQLFLCPRHSKNGGASLSVTPVHASVRYQNLVSAQ